MVEVVFLVSMLIQSVKVDNGRMEQIGVFWY